MLDLIRKFAGSRRGSIAVITALSAPMVFAVVGVAMDYFMMVHIKGQLQVAADSAAIAGVKELSLSGVTDKQVTAVAESFVYTNLGKLSEEDIKEGNLGIDVKIVKEKRIVEVDIKQEWTPFFMQFVNSDVTPIRARAQATTIGQRLACVLGLSELTPPGVQLWSKASLVADGCDVYSNTSLPLGLAVNDDATLKADLICVSGGYVALSPGAVVPKPLTDCPKFDDPLASRPAPKVTGCDHLAMIIINQKKTLNPGVYCGGLTILGNSKVKLNPGVYIINKGLLKVSGTASMTGENVGFYLSGLLTLMFFDGGTTIDLTPRRTGHSPASCSLKTARPCRCASTVSAATMPETLWARSICPSAFSSLTPMPQLPTIPPTRPSWCAACSSAKGQSSSCTAITKAPTSRCLTASLAGRPF